MTKTILIVDDEDSILHALKRVLRRTNYRVLTANNGADALALLDSEDIQVVLSDQRMPTMTGSEFLGLVDQRYPHTIRMILTGYADLNSVADAINRGHIFKFLLKPWDEETLLDNIREAFHRYELGIKGEQFTKIYENTAEGILITDSQGQIQAANPAFTTITGYTESEVIGQLPSLFRSEKHDENFYRTLWDALLAEGKWAGEIWNTRKNGEVYPAWLNISAICDQHGKIQQYVALFTDITVHKVAEEALRHRAYHDPLTDLPNRLMYTEQLDQALHHAHRHQHTCAVMMLDLDHFKQINDTYGHEFGDKLLVTVARRMRECLRKEDVLARMGGDEFTLLLPHAEDAHDVTTVAEKILAAFKTPMMINGLELSITPSMGVAIYPADGLDPETLLKNADAAMYQVKQAGRNAFRLFTPASTDNHG